MPERPRREPPACVIEAQQCGGGELYSLITNERPSSPMLVSAREPTLRLPPSQAAAYDSWHVQGWSVEQAAAARGVKIGTMRSYLLEAIAAGLEYDWTRLEVPTLDEERVQAVARRLLTESCAENDIPEGPSKSCCKETSAEVISLLPFPSLPQGTTVTSLTNVPPQGSPDSQLGHPGLTVKSVREVLDSEAEMTRVEYWVVRAVLLHMGRLGVIP